MGLEKVEEEAVGVGGFAAVGARWALAPECRLLLVFALNVVLLFLKNLVYLVFKRNVLDVIHP